MSARRLVVGGSALALAAVAGWYARGPVGAVPPGVPPAVPANLAHAPSASRPGVASIAQPLIAVSADGQVTLRVEQQPLDWVLDQIAAQTGYTDLRERVRPPAGAASSAMNPTVLAAAEPETACADTPVLGAEDTRRALAAIERGSEAERLDGLLAAVSGAVPVPETLLKTLYETDASDPVRLIAFERYLEARAGDPAALRPVLEAALYVPNAAVQQEARRRLDELNGSARPDPTDPQQAYP